MSYAPIASYAVIGDRRTAALVGRDGSIDWLCLPRLDSASLFGAVLDHDRGGRWVLAPVGERRSSRSYRAGTAILETLYEGSEGSVRVTDFLVRPLQKGSCLVRRVEGLSGQLRMRSLWDPRPDYGRLRPRIEVRHGTLSAVTDAHGFAVLAYTGILAWREIADGGVEATFDVSAGESLDFVLSGPGTTGEVDSPAERCLPLCGQLEAATTSEWQEWSRSLRIDASSARMHDVMERSAMVLRLLGNEESGAIAAAATTSLPEEIGGVRNWDYRFTWVRDSSMIAQALCAVGGTEEARAFLAFLLRAARQHARPGNLRIMYGLSGELSLTEHELTHLEGYRESRPVRIGNGAAGQRQLDIFGELADAAFDLAALDGRLSDETWQWLGSLADHVCEAWKLRDRGIWEVRGPERHFTHSKLMCWVALDRCIRLAEVHGAPAAQLERWQAEAFAIRAAILSEGFDPVRNSFTQTFGSPALDASTLLIPLLGFLPPDDPRVLGTIDAIRGELMHDGLVARYRVEQAEDGLAGGEGEFLICSFWMVQCLARAGRVHEAREIFDSLASRSNDLLLLAEEVDAHTGEQLGNFPQAFSHLGLIQAARDLIAAAGPQEGRAA